MHADLVLSEHKNTHLFLSVEAFAAKLRAANQVLFKKSMGK